jgi:hypothetical protein
VTSLDEELDVGIHEWDGHGDIATIGKNVLRMVTEFLDETEDIVLLVSTIR